MSNMLVGGHVARFQATTLAAVTIAAWAALTIIVCHQVKAETISFDDGRVSFDAPEGFRSLTREEIAMKYPRGDPPDFALGNKDATTSIAYGLKEIPLREDQLTGAENSIEKSFERMIPHLQWQGRRLIKINNKQWIYLEFLSAAINADIHNIVLATSYEGKLLIFNFNSTREDFLSTEAMLRSSIASITLR